MKLLKNIYLLGILIGLVAFTGCSEDSLVEPTPSPEALAGTQGIYFPSENESAFELEPTDEKQFELTIARKKTSGAAEIPINVEINDEDIFNVPATVSFADGDSVKTFTVTFPNAAEGKNYNLKLNVDGEEFINPYSTGNPYVETSVIRIKWFPIAEPMIYVDGTFSAFFGVGLDPMYVTADSAKVGDAVRYRFKNAYKVPTGEYVGDDYEPTPDEYGIYDGYPNNEPEDFDESKNYYTVIEIDYEDEDAYKNNQPGDVSMLPGDIGVDWGYGMHSIGSVFGNLSQKLDEYPLGEMEDGIITFPANSLYMNMANHGTGVAGKPTTIYLTKEIFIAANSKITDFNALEYEAIEDGVGTFITQAYADSTWVRTIEKAVVIDPDNEDSEYKDLFYLPNLYKENFGLAFYYINGDVVIPANQPTGDDLFGKKIYVSASEEIFSTVDEDSEGTITGYNFGLKFHYKDGTNLGDFEEKFLLSNEDEITPMINARNGANYRFQIQGKVSPKALKRNVQGALVF